MKFHTFTTAFKWSFKSNTIDFNCPSVCVGRIDFESDATFVSDKNYCLKKSVVRVDDDNYIIVFVDGVGSYKFYMVNVVEVESCFNFNEVLSVIQSMWLPVIESIVDCSDYVVENNLVGSK